MTRTAKPKVVRVIRRKRRPARIIATTKPQCTSSPGMLAIIDSGGIGLVEGRFGSPTSRSGPSTKKLMIAIAM